MIMYQDIKVSALDDFLTPCMIAFFLVMQSE